MNEPLYSCPAPRVRRDNGTSWCRIDVHELPGFELTEAFGHSMCTQGTVRHRHRSPFVGGARQTDDEIEKAATLLAQRGELAFQSQRRREKPQPDDRGPTDVGQHTALLEN